MDECSRILPLLRTGLSCWLLELPLSVLVVVVVVLLVVVVVVVVVVAAPRFRLRRRLLALRLVVARDAVAEVVILIFVIIIVLNLMVGVAGGDVVCEGTSSAMHHAVDSDVSWVSCITCRR